MSPEIRKLQGQDIQIQATLWPGDNTIPLLCIHGLAANCRSWDTLCAAIVPHYSIIAVDLRGRGQSDQPDSGYSVHHHGQDLRCALDDLGIAQVIPMGHSFGALVAMAFAASYPDRVAKLVLIDGGGQLSEEQLANIMPIVQLPFQRLGKVYPSAETYIEQIKQNSPIDSWDQTVETMYRYELAEVEGGVSPRTQIAHLVEEIENAKALDVGQFYGKLSLPVLILRATQGVFGDQDIVLPVPVAQHMVEQIPNAQCLDVEANHFSILLEDNPRRNQQILKFLNQ